MTQIFISYSRKDLIFIEQLAADLHGHGFTTWYDLSNLGAGDRWNKIIEKAIVDSQYVIIVLSPDSVESEYVDAEITFAKRWKKKIIPLYYLRCELGVLYINLNYIDVQGSNYGKNFYRVLEELGKTSVSVKTDTPKKEEKPVEKEQDGISWLDDYHKRHARPLSEFNANKLTLSNGMEFMRVPAGKFLMGSTKENLLAHENERPQHTVDIPYEYWMARFPVTNELYNTYVIAKGIEHPLDEWRKKKDHPVGRVNWADVMMYCQWINEALKSELPYGLILRLPTEAEWEKAARSVDAREYPWGNQFKNASCNCDEATNFFSKFTSAFTHDTTSVQNFSPQGDSPYGCADMVGNVLEWTHSLYKKYPYKDNDGRENEFSSEYRVQRGGSLGFGGLVDPRCANRGHDDAVVRYYTLGFRICLATPLS